MKKTALALGLFAAAFSATAAYADVSEDRDLEEFTRVEIDGLMDVNIKVGEKQSFTITANKEKFLETVKTRVRNGTLRVDMDSDEHFFSLFKKIDVRIDITVPALEGVNMDGLGDIIIQNVDADEFEIVLDGLGSADIDGRCKSARMIIDGMGDLNAKNFKCERVRLTVDGMGDADVYASKYIYINLDGFGDVEVYGDPEDREVSKDGMGDIDFN